MTEEGCESLHTGQRSFARNVKRNSTATIWADGPTKETMDARGKLSAHGAV